MVDTMKLSYWDCDACQRTLLHGEYRFHCTVCDDYDYCEQCAAVVEPPHPHRMVRELAYGCEEKKACAKYDLASKFQTATAMYWDRHCLGVRDVDKDNPSTYANSYSWLTFKTVGDRSHKFGHGLRRLIEPRGYLGICAHNRPEWVITDFACIFQNIISVPIYTLFNDSEIAYIINNTQISVIVCHKQRLPRFIKLYSLCSSLRHIVCMDPIIDTISENATEGNLTIHYMDEIEKYGSVKQYDYITIEPDDCLTVIYTSGSSGFPKGAMISESTFRGKLLQWYAESPTEWVTLSYQPMAWGAGRYTNIATFLVGGRTGFSTEDPASLMEELALVGPTHFGGPSSICNKIYTEFKAALALITASHPSAAIPVEEQRLLYQFSKLIPKRCKIISIGGAMVSPVILNFMRRCFIHCWINESYGITECGSVTCNNIIEQTLQYRLESVPDMGYTLDDKPFPRGELLIKTTDMFSGYINNLEETHAALTEDGFFRSGDIVELRTNQIVHDGLRVIDRKKNFFKLSQGQFVSPEFLHGIYIQSPFVHQIYIHGDLLSDSVAAVIVPNRNYTQAFALKHNLTHFDMNKPDPQFCNAVLKDLRSIAEKESLRKYEIPSRIIVDFEPFTAKNGLLTSTMKPCRLKLAAHYADRLKTPNIIEQRLKTIIETATGHSISTDKEENFFLANGGDSLAAVRLSRMIENDLGIPLPLSILFEPKLTLQQLTTLIKHPSQLSTFSQSIIPQLLRDSDLDLNITVGQRKTTAPNPSMIFITGTTGFVGAFLLAELLTIYPSNCKFICLVRCKSRTNPLDRIRLNMSFYQIWKEHYKERIIALPGDLAKSYFGLDSKTYETLATQTDLIFHCGATVNFVFSYSRLHGPNVCGTQEIIRLATHTASTCIPVQYISTISVLPPGIDDKISIDQISPDKLISGYAQSKWVAEKLITKASRCGLPVVIYRLGLISADSRTGACNRHDLYTLLFAAMMKMRCYPESAAHGCLHGLPVDFTAKSIVYLSSVQPDLYGHIYHVTNSNSEVLFEDMIDSMRKCGIQMESVSSNEWRMKVKTITDQNSPFESVREFLLNSEFRQRGSLSAEQFYSDIGLLDFPVLGKDYAFKWSSFILATICVDNSRSYRL